MVTAEVLSRLLDRLYEGVLDEAAWRGALEELARAGDFDGERVAALEALRPHLAGIVQLRLRLGTAEAAAEQLREALDLIGEGVLLVDAAGTIRHANAAARALLGAGAGLGTAAGALACDHPDDTRALRRLVAAAATGPGPGAGGTVTVRRRSGGRPLSILVEPLRRQQRLKLAPPPAAMVLVGDPERADPAPRARLRDLYGLTAAEARMALAVPDAHGLRDLADRLGVRLATVRTHLQHVFEKTGTHRQAELVRLLMAHRLPVLDDRPLVPPPACAAAAS